LRTNTHSGWCLTLERESGDETEERYAEPKTIFLIFYLKRTEADMDKKWIS
jgi:hypothetical protein